VAPHDRQEKPAVKGCGAESEPGAAIAASEVPQVVQTEVPSSAGEPQEGQRNEVAADPIDG
jgi:hypothetical protein